MNSESKEQNLDFIRSIIKAEQLNGKNNGKVHTRFPPEPMAIYT